MSAAFETLPPDQRAVLQLILKQGRGYADLSGLLKIDEAAVRARAHAGLDALAPAGAGDALSDERRAQIADWLLGQQDDADRAATLQHLEDSRAARRWAGALHEQLAPVASAGLPEVPVASNGAGAVAPAPAAAPAAAGGAHAADDARAAARAAAPASTPRRPTERRASKLGGALLLGGLAVLVAVVLIVVLGGGDDDPADEAPPAQTQAQTQRAGDSRAAAGEPIVLQQVNLNAPGGGRAVGVAFLMIQNERPVVAIQVQDVAPNGRDDIYAAWLRASDGGRARFLGYVPDQVGANGRFTVSSALPNNTASYDQVVVSREAVGVTETPRTPGEIVLEGTIRVNRDAGTG